MNDTQRLQLNKMIKTNNVEDVTSNIREKKHSDLIEKDINTLVKLKTEYSHVSLSNPDQYDEMLCAQCSFLYEHYTDLFNRLKKDELDLTIMHKFVGILRNIELGEIDQHEGAYMVGKYLKEIYIDSAMRRGEKLDKEFSSGYKHPPPDTKNISWSEYKRLYDNN